MPIPDDVPDEKALYLTDIIPTGLHGAMLGQVIVWDIGRFEFAFACTGARWLFSGDLGLGPNWIDVVSNKQTSERDDIHPIHLGS